MPDQHQPDPTAVRWLSIKVPVAPAPEHGPTGHSHVKIDLFWEGHRHAALEQLLAGLKAVGALNENRREPRLVKTKTDCIRHLLDRVAAAAGIDPLRVRLDEED